MFFAETCRGFRDTAPNDPLRCAPLPPPRRVRRARPDPGGDPRAPRRHAPASDRGSSRRVTANDFTFASLRGNAVVRWEYLPGSTLFLVWTQSRSASEDIGSFRLGESFDQLIGAKADNIFLVKLTYWWNP